MDKRLTKNISQTIGGVLVLIVLMGAGMFLHARWDLRRFKPSFEELPEVSPVTVSEREKMINTHAEKPPPAETTAPKSLTRHNIELEYEGLEMETSSLETLDSLIEGPPFLIEGPLSLEIESSEKDIAYVKHENHEERGVKYTARFQEKIDNRGVLASIISSLEDSNVDTGSGAPEDLATVIEMLKRATKGPMNVDDLITMTEAWLRIQPTTPRIQSGVNITREALTYLLLRLQNYKEKSLQSGKETELFCVY